MQVMNRKKKEGTIQHIDDAFVTLQFDGGEHGVPSGAFLHESFRQVQPKKEQEEVEWVASSPSAAVEMKLAVLRSTILLQLQGQWAEFEKAVKQNVQVWRNPKDVTVKKDFAPKKLIVPLTTPKVAITPLDADPPPAGICVGIYEGYHVSLQPCTQHPKAEAPMEAGFLNPCWIMGKPEEGEEAVMELSPDETKLASQKITLEDGAPALPVVRKKRKLEKDESLTFERPSKKGC